MVVKATIGTAFALLLLVCFELGLRLTGYGYPTSYFVAHEDGDHLVTNTQFGWRFFGAELSRPPLATVVSEAKPEGVVRVVVFGGSAARGFPAPAFSFARVVQAMLEESFPGQRFEVINTAMTAINSNVVLPIVKDCARLDADLFVVYLGNNEVVGPFGAGSIFGRNVDTIPMIRLRLWVRSTRLGQLLDSMVAKLAGDTPGPRRWSGMEMFLSQQLAWGDPRLDRVYANFQRNLEDIAAQARARGTPVLFSTVLANQKDLPPFRSEHSNQLDFDERAKWQEGWATAHELASMGEWGQAREELSQIESIDDRYAELFFLEGTYSLQLGDVDPARAAFGRALDLDALRFRADSRINEVIRDVAIGQEGAHLVDAVSSATTTDSLPPILGDELLYEHVHLNFRGHYQVASALLPDIVEQLGMSSESPVRVPSLASCARRVGYDDFFHASLQQQIAGVMARPPFARSTALAAAIKSQQLQAGLRSDELAAAAEAYRQAVAEDPEDLMTRNSYAFLSYARQDFATAATEYRELIRRYPQDLFWQQRYGEVLLQQGDLAAARAQFDHVLELDETYVEAYGSLANLEVLGGNPEAAVDNYQRALAIDPRSVHAHYRLGRLLLEQGDLAGAAEHLSQAVVIEPIQAEMQFYLARALAGLEQFEHAVAAYERALELSPNTAAMHYNLGMLYFRLGRVEWARARYARAIQLDSGFAQNPPYRLGGVVNQPKAGEVCIRPLRRAVAGGTASARDYLHLGMALEFMGAFSDAWPSYRKAHELEPEMEEAIYHLARTYAYLPADPCHVGADALRLARRAVELTASSDPSRLAVEAAVLARRGEYEQAVDVADQALALAQRQGPQPLSELIREQRARYLTRRAYDDPRFVEETR